MRILLQLLVVLLLQLLLVYGDTDAKNSSTSSTLDAYTLLLKSNAGVLEKWGSQDIKLFTEKAGFSDAFCA